MRTSAVIGGAAAYLGVSVAGRRWHRAWGATYREIGEPLPGDALIDAAAMQATRAITIAAAPEQVWPWLAQMGQGRGGLYTYTWIENALRADIHNLNRIDPELQALRVGDHVRLTPEPYLGRLPGQFYTVSEIRPGEALVMLQQLPTGGRTSWSFIVRARADGTTRLLVRTRASAPTEARARVARALELLLLEPGYFLMERGMLRGIRRRAEAHAGRRPAIVGEIVIARPVEEVFDTVADERNEPRYNPRLASVEKASAGPIGVGTRWLAATARGRRRIPMTIEVTAYERPRRLASRTRLAGMDIDGQLSFEPVTGGTRMRWCWDLRPHGPLRLLGPLIARVGARQEREIWSSLKRFLETSPDAIAGGVRRRR